MRFEQDITPVFLVVEVRDEDDHMMIHGVYEVVQLALAAAMHLQNQIDCATDHRNLGCVSVQNSLLYGPIRSTYEA